MEGWAVASSAAAVLEARVREIPAHSERRWSSSWFCGGVMPRRVTRPAPPIAPTGGRPLGWERSRYAQGVNIEEFYAEDERRRASVEIELGRDWRDAKGVRYELSWVQDTGELYTMREPVPGAYEDPFGDIYVDAEDLDGLVVRKLGIVTSHERVEEILVGWPEAMVDPDGVEWIIGRLRGAGVLDG